jgi:hypothetical protein
MYEGSPHAAEPVPRGLDVVVLVGAPSGAGKTFFTRSKILSTIPTLNQSLNGAVVRRWDLKALPEEPDPSVICVIEIATQHLSYYEDKCWRRLKRDLDGKRHIVVIDLAAPRLQLIKQLWRRTHAWFHGKQGWRGAWNVPRYFGVLRLTTRYLSPNALNKFQGEWNLRISRLLEAQRQARLTKIVVRLARDGCYTFEVKDCTKEVELRATSGER